jgi:hypothetical protein
MNYNPIYKKFIDDKHSVSPKSMRKGKFYLIKKYEYVDGDKASYSISNGPIIYVLYTSTGKDVVHCVKVSEINPQLVKRFFGKFIDVDEQKLKMKGGAQAFYEGVVSKVKIVKNDAYRTYKLSGIGSVIELDMDITNLVPKNKIK